MMKLDDPGLAGIEAGQEPRSFTSGNASCRLAELGFDLGKAEADDGFARAARLRVEGVAGPAARVARLRRGPVTGRSVVPNAYTLQASPVAAAPVDTGIEAGVASLPAEAAIRGLVAGSRILTSRGEVAIETLAEGDLVFGIGSCGLVPVRLAGYLDVDLRGHADPDSVNPVRIRADALGAGRPNRDLILSPNHALYIDGKLIAVRFLLNGATIVQERGESVRYYHIGLGAHDVVLTDGLAAESHLDSGACQVFAGTGAVELAVLRQGLLDRAKALGHVLTADADIRVVVGRRIVRPSVVAGGAQFLLPDKSSRVRIVSRSFVPREVHAAHGDGRRLGLGVARIRLDERDLALDDASLSKGWHALEPGLRWTNGEAWLETGSARVLTFALLDGATYWMDAVKRPARKSAKPVGKPLRKAKLRQPKPAKPTK